jgi:lysozyme
MEGNAVMKTSDAGVVFISRWEGFVNHVYRDVGGKKTIGYGHLVKPGEVFPTEITEVDALDLLRLDIATAEAAVNGLGVDLSQNAFDALVSFAFNLGGGILGKGHTLGDALRVGDYDAAARAFVLYDHVDGVENAGLRARRTSEAELFTRA